MRHNRAKLVAELRYFATYMLEDVQPRALYPPGGSQYYRPEIMIVELYSNAAGEAPDPTGLSVTRVTVNGPKLKKDGTPGAATWREVFPTIRSLPGEFRMVADELLLELIRKADV